MRHITITAIAVIGALGITVAHAAGQDQKPTGSMIVAQNDSPTYRAQLDKIRAAIGAGDQRKVNHEVVTLLGILEERPMSAPDTKDMSLSEEMMQVIRLQEERAGTSI